MAHKKGVGSSQNGRDSNPKYLGCKRFAGEFVTGGTVIVRQRGSRFYPGANAGKGNDDTIYAKVDGYLRYYTRRNRRYIDVLSERV